MQSKNLKPNVWYGVLQPWRRWGRTDYNPYLISKRNATKARLVSLDKYVFNPYSSDTYTSSDFVLAQQGEKSVAYLMEMEIGQRYFLVRAKDVVEEWDILTARWDAEEVEAQRVAAEQAAARVQREEQERARLRNLTRVEQNVRKVLLDLVKVPVTVQPGSMLSMTDSAGVVKPTDYLCVDLRSIERLVEKYLELKDEVGV